MGQAKEVKVDQKEIEKSWHGWVVFTQWATWSGVIVAVILGLMAATLV